MSDVTDAQVAIVRRARYDAQHCGDACGHWHADGITSLCVVDGLGHGEAAEVAANLALDYVARHLSQSLPEIFAGCDAHLRSTRGVVMGVAMIDEVSGRLAYAGVGNPRALVCGRNIVMFGASPGIVGGGYRSLTNEAAMLRPGDLVILTTDGVEKGFDARRYDSTLRADVHGLAERIMHDWRRESDDAAVLVFRHTGGR